MLDSATIARSPARTLADLLAGRVAGLNVTHPTGAPGYAPELTARGAASFVGPGRPLLYVDGVLLREDRQLTGGDIDRNKPSHAWNLPTDEIAEVEIALGPASGALLAFGASRGAVLVRTRRGGRGGRGAWHVTSSVDATHQPAPSEFRTRTFTTGDIVAGGTTEFCPLTDQATGFCVPNGTVTRVPFGGRSPFQSSTGVRGSVSASGAAHIATLRAGASFDRAPSSLDGTAFERLDLSATAQSHAWRGLTATITARYARTGGSYVTFGENGLMQVGLSAVQPNDTTLPLVSRDVATLLERARPYRTDRFNGALDLAWSPRPWLTAYALGAVDEAARVTDVTYQVNNAFSPFEPISMRREDRSYGQSSGAGTIGVRASRALPRDFRLSGDLGGMLTNVDLWEAFETRTEFVDGGSEETSDPAFAPTVRSRAVFAAARLQWGEHRWIAGGFRKETTRIFELPFGDDPFNTMQASWGISKERFFPRVPGVDQLRLRAAYGESGDHESVLAAFRVASAFGNGVGEIRRRLQRTLEREFGADLDLLGGRAQLRVTGFARSMRDGYLPSNANFPTPPITFVSWGTHGHEWTLAIPSRGIGPLRWDASLAWSSARTRITQMQLVEAQFTLLGGARVRIAERVPFGAIHANGFDWSDADGDGIVDATEISIGAPERRGVTQPTDLIAATFTASWRDRVSAGVTLDGKFGHVKVDATQRFGCQVLVCDGLYSGSPATQARAVGSGYTASFTGPVHAADLVRARDLWVRAVLPSQLGARALPQASLTLSVRNAGLWSRYPGGDPETGSFAFATVQRGDYMTPALPRTITLRLDVAR